MSRHYRFREFLPVLLDANPTALFVYDYLESRRNIRGRAYPSLMTIAQELKRSERTIRRCIDLLMSYGVLRLVPYKERVDDEKKVHNSRKVYEFTGKANVNGKIIPLEYEADKPKRLILRMPLRPRKTVHVDTRVQMENESHVDTHVQWTPMSHLSIKRTNNIESFHDVLPEESPIEESPAPQNPPIIELPKTSQLPQVEIEEKRSADIAIVEEKALPKPKGRSKTEKKKSAWFTMTLEQAQTNGCYTHSPHFAELDQHTTKPYWNIISAMVAWNASGKSRDEYLSLLKATDPDGPDDKNAAIRAFNAKVKNACLAWEEWVTDTSPIKVEEMEWIARHWIKSKFKERPAHERYFPVSYEAIANNIAELRAAYQEHLQKLARQSQKAA